MDSPGVAWYTKRPYGRVEFPLPAALQNCTFHNVNSAGLWYEAEEVHRCLRLGLLESPKLPNVQSLALLQTMDSIAAQDVAPGRL